MIHYRRICLLPGTGFCSCGAHSRLFWGQLTHDHIITTLLLLLKLPVLYVGSSSTYNQYYQSCIRRCIYDILVSDYLRWQLFQQQAAVSTIQSLLGNSKKAIWYELEPCHMPSPVPAFSHGQRGINIQYLVLNIYSRVTVYLFLLLVRPRRLTSTHTSRLSNGFFYSSCIIGCLTPARACKQEIKRTRDTE